MDNTQHGKHGGSRRNTARRSTARQTRRSNQPHNTATKTTAKATTTPTAKTPTASTSPKPFRFDELNPTQQRRRTWIAGIVVATVFAGSLITCATRVAAFTPTFQREVSCKELAHKGDVAKDNLNKAATEAREKLDLLTSATKENDVELYDFVRTHKKEIDALSNTLDEIENEPVDNFTCDKNATKKDAQFYRDDIAVQTNKLQRAIFPVFGNVEHLTIVKVCREIATEVANQEATIATMEEKFRALDDRVNKAQQALNEATEKDAARIEFVANDAPLKSDEVQGTQSALQGAASRIQELRTQSETLTPPQPCKSGITRINQIPKHSNLHDPQAQSHEAQSHEAQSHEAQSHEAQSYGDMITTLDELEKNTTPNITRAHEFADHAEKTYQARVAKHEEVVAQREAERKRQELAAKQRAEANRLKLNTMSSQELEKLQGDNEDNLPEGVSKQHVETALHNAREREEAERRAQESAEEAQARREAEAKARERAKREAQQRNQDMQTRATQQRPAISQQRQQTQNQRRQSQQRQNRQRQNRQRQNQQRQQPRQQQHQQRQQTRTQEGVRSQERKRQQQQHIRQQQMQQRVQ